MLLSMLGSVFATVLLFVSTTSASPDRRLRAEHAKVTAYLRPTRVEVRDIGTTTAPSDNLQTDICGWVGGNGAQPWVCQAPGTCLVDPAINAIGCCTSNNCGTFRTACFPLTVSCGSDCASNGANLVCGETDKPLCATYSYPNSVTELRCVSSAPDPSLLEIDYTFAGFSSILNLPRVLHGVTGTTAPGSYSIVDYGIQTPSSSTSLTTTSGKSGTPTSTGNPSTTNSQPPSTSITPSTSKSSAGAIAGGVVGGLAVLAAIGLLFFYFRRRSNNRNVQEMSRGNTPAYNTIPLEYQVAKNSAHVEAELPEQPRYHDTRPSEMQA